MRRLAIVVPPSSREDLGEMARQVEQSGPTFEAGPEVWNTCFDRCPGACCDVESVDYRLRHAWAAVSLDDAALPLVGSGSISIVASR